MAIVTLTTDFGLRDPWVGSLKGALLSIATNLTLVDLTHDVPRHNVAAASYVVAAASRHFPAGTIHLVVVDPGVGGARRPLACAAGGAMFVGPDNGVFDRVLGRDPDARCVEITDPRVMRRVPSDSPTFQGRDVFAPVAACLALGTRLDDLGPAVDDPIRLSAPDVRRNGSTWIGEVVWVDRFGNLISNIEVPSGVSAANVRVGASDLPVVACYSDGPTGEAAALINSDRLIEVFVNRGDASETLKAGTGAPVFAAIVGKPGQT
ncbi:MAG: SAM hydrolase/SAM-dependent halogenase family protein [Nitrospirota bacterium]